ncbi:CPBP family intramembrane glutamic endopeptidase [Alkalibacterium kapii]|uniref:CAAX prenyl protease 2/Lysostaphin resistance protein A-like domain-containing protein n=1 Tax=Alkalibacterium kapii TaxID=426704 RepID=A0A511ATA8_9LACT|nr:type II CAAX endopeptidase family protein [Alkalibacterium kapii]GEK90543.1 hypothetical protein AKA01nite_01650 [Alkalibacterium kapii]
MNNSIQNKKAATRIILLFILVQLLSGIVPAFLPQSLGLKAVLVPTLIFFALGAIGAVLIEKRFNMSFAFEESFSSQKKDVLIWGILGVFVALFAQTIANFIEVQCLGSGTESVNTQILVDFVKKYPVFILAIGIAGPILEEFVFRKAIFGMLIGKTGGIGAAVISSLIFAFIHFDGFLLVYSSMGFVFSWLYFKTKSIWTPIIAHCLMNIMAVLGNVYLS